MRLIVLVGAVTMCLGVSISPAKTSHSNASDPNPCELESSHARRAHSLMRVFLTDTGDVGATYDSTRIELGIVGITYDQIGVVQDTVKCRAALNSFKALYETFGQEEGAKAAGINNGMLFQVTPNRFILAVPYYDPWLGLSYVAMDSNAVVVRKNL